MILTDDEIEKHWEEFRSANPNTIGGFQEQYPAFAAGYKAAQSKGWTDGEVPNIVTVADSVIVNTSQGNWTDKDLRLAFEAGRQNTGLSEHEYVFDTFEDYLKQPPTL